MIANMWVGLLAIMGMMVVLWVLSLLLKNSSIVDIFWGPGFLLAGTAYALAGNGWIVREYLLLFMVAVWSLRLGIHIYIRNNGKAEDFRYQVWRKENGANWWWRSFFQVFVLQGILMWLVSFPLNAAFSAALPNRFTWLDGVGIIIWIIGFLFEAGGDAQLAAFKRDESNKGKVMRYGFWKYTRHPNYFGDSAQWWGFYLIALTAGGWWTIFSPFLMTYLLLKVSGVALLEKSLAERKPEYAEYMKSTSAFFPWFPKS